MDKRWISILIIIILAICCGYLIVSSSNTVGNAIVDVNKSTVTIPHHFSVGSEEKDSIVLNERSGTAKIFVKDLGKISNFKKLFDKEVKSLSDNEEIDILKNTTNSTADFEYYTVYYQDYSDSEMYNKSITYLYKFKHTYLVKCDGFKDTGFLDSNLDLIINTIKLDYKKSQE